MVNDVIAWIAELGYWSWWTLAIILVILEIFAPTFFLLWLGVAAALVGFAVLFFPSMSWEYQWGLFALFSIVSLLLARMFLKRNPGVEDNFKLNQRGAQYVGRTFTLVEAIDNGRGKIHVDDSQWTVSGPELPAGSKVTVTGHDGTLLIVDKAK
ncbi:NfeD family protein [Sneathiella glossodoripedis]|uniref:NfeD family protein n=1 Tax=Sneathiella glossodoripedis TaxID=418853 RepID=UPI00055D2F90|nr:NfeD family protein [Sneathiella glossodoripedis]